MLYNDVQMVHWINSQEYKSFEIYVVTIKISMTELYVVTIKMSVTEMYVVAIKISVTEYHDTCLINRQTDGLF